MPFILFDIDGSICDSPYPNNNSSKYLTPEFGLLLEQAQVCSWVRDSGLSILGEIEGCAYITGRPVEWFEVTRAWLERNKFPSGVLLCMGFKGRASYVREKLQLFQQHAREHEKTIIVEDDVEVINETRAQLPQVHVIQIINGGIA